MRSAGSPYARASSLRDEPTLRARETDERARRLEPGRRDLRLDVRLVIHGVLNVPGYDHVARVECGGGVALGAATASSTFAESSFSSPSSLPWSTPAWIDSRSAPAPPPRRRVVRAAAPGHRVLHVDDRRERLVVDEHDLRAVLGDCLGLADDDCDGLSREDDLLARERLRGAVVAVDCDREVGGRQHGDDARDLEGSSPSTLRMRAWGSVESTGRACRRPCT